MLSAFIYIISLHPEKKEPFKVEIISIFLIYRETEFQSLRAFLKTTQMENKLKLELEPRPVSFLNSLSFISRGWVLNLNTMEKIFHAL